MREIIVSVLAVVVLASCNKDPGTGTPGAASAAAPASACAAGQLSLDGPRICVAAPDGYVKPVDVSNSKQPASGNLNVSYSADGTVGGKFVATFTVTYNASKPASYTYLEKDMKEYCDTPPSLETIADGKGKYFQCKSTKLEGNNYAKAEIFTDKNNISCSSQSKGKPEVDSVCKTLKQL